MKITMLGLQNALTWKNQSLFDNLNLPSGIDKDSVVDNILLEGGDFEVLYADPYFMRAAISTWSSKHYRTFEKWITALNIEYNPLENYDRQENWTDTLDSDTTNNNTTGATDVTANTTGATDARTTSGTNQLNGTVTVDTTTSGTESSNGSTENTVSAFDSNSYQPSDKSDTDLSTTTSTDSDSSTTTAQTTTDNYTDNFTHQGSDDTTFTHTGTNNDVGTRDDTTVHTGRVHGNVGVTTSQQMLQSELDIARFNIVQQITDLFLTEFCIMIYT